jgi:hypothetical protein
LYRGTSSCAQSFVFVRVGVFREGFTIPRQFTRAVTDAALAGQVQSEGEHADRRLNGMAVETNYKAQIYSLGPELRCLDERSGRLD